MTVTDTKAYWVASSLQKTRNQSILHHLQLKSQGLIKIYQIARLKFCHPIVPKIDIHLLPRYHLKQKPMLLPILPNYCEKFSSNQTTKIYPKVLTEFFDEKYRGLDYANLFLKCKEISFAANFSEEQAKLIFNEIQ